MNYDHEAIQARLARFSENIGPSLHCFVTIFAERLGKLEARDDQAAIEACFNQMEELYLLILESASSCKQQRIPDDVVLPVERAVIRLVWSVINNEPLSRERAQ